MNCRLGIAALDIFEQLDQDLGMSVGLNQGGYLLVAYRKKSWILSGREWNSRIPSESSRGR
jgi:hypothetical protein